MLDVKLLAGFVLHNDKSVWTLSLQPAVGPLDEFVILGSFSPLYFSECIVHAVDKVVQFSVLAGVELAVLLEAKFQSVASHEVVHDFDPAGTLRIGDHIEGVFTVASVADLHLNRVSSWLKISVEGSLGEGKRHVKGVRVHTDKSITL